MRKAGLLIAIALATSVTTVAVANHQPWHKVMKGGATTRVAVATGENDKVIATTDWTTIPGATLQMKVPDGQHALLLARFTAETVCYGSLIDYCSLRVRVGDRDAYPSAGREFHIDSHYGSETAESEKGHAFARAIEVGPGTHTLEIQGAAMGGTELKVDDWSFTVSSSRT